MPLRLVLSFSAGAALLWACGSDSDDGTSTTASGRGGAGAAHATSVANSSGDGGGADGGRPCMGCGEFETSSHPGKTVCNGASAKLFDDLEACRCMACAAPCSTACAGGPITTDCTACKIVAEASTCADAYDACAGDI